MSEILFDKRAETASGNPADIRPYKKSLRVECKNKRRLMSADVKLRYDRKITNKLLNLWAVREAESVFVYVSTQIEVDTIELINTLLALGKKVAVPKCENQDGHMNFYYINSLDELSPGYFGVLEPLNNASPAAFSAETVCIVPAFLFDVSGFRLGYGKGYYDRFLSGFCGKAIGICYDDELKDALVHGKYDKTVDMVITQRRIVSTK